MSVVYPASGRYNGTYPNPIATLSTIDLLSNISTGNDMFIIDFPDMRFDPSCLMIILIMSF